MVGGLERLGLPDIVLLFLVVAKSWRLIFLLFVGFAGAGLPDDNWQKKQLVAVEAEMGSDRGSSGHADGKWRN